MLLIGALQVCYMQLFCLFLEVCGLQRSYLGACGFGPGAGSVVLALEVHSFLLSIRECTGRA